MGGLDSVSLRVEEDKVLVSTSSLRTTSQGQLDPLC